jgi:hypothetical protein
VIPPPLIEIPKGSLTDFHRVGPRLYVGAWPGDGPEMRHQAERMGFARVIRCAYEFPNEYPLNDCRLTPELIRMFEKASDDVADGLRKGQRTLVTCHKGINRSALVAGLAMVKAYRFTGRQALMTIRAFRKVPESDKYALWNVSFATYLVNR